MYPYSASARRSSRSTSSLHDVPTFDGGLLSIPSDIQVDSGVSDFLNYEYSSAPPYSSQYYSGPVDRSVSGTCSQVNHRFAHQLPWNTYNPMLHPEEIARQQANYYSSQHSNTVSPEAYTLLCPPFVDSIPEDISMGVSVPSRNSFLLSSQFPPSAPLLPAGWVPVGSHHSHHSVPSDEYNESRGSNHSVHSALSEHRLFIV